MNDRDNFLVTIAANPADDTARLVFADWLQDNGEPERAALIRAEHAARTKRGRATRAEYRGLQQTTSWLTPAELDAVRGPLIGLSGAGDGPSRLSGLIDLAAALSPLHPDRAHIVCLAERLGDWLRIESNADEADEADEPLDDIINDEMMADLPRPRQDRANWIEDAIAVLASQLKTPHCGGMLNLSDILQSSDAS